MSLGSLQYKVVLDQPNKTVYGPYEDITGTVNLTYIRYENQSQELFGPLKLSIFLHGRAKSKIWRRQGRYTHIYRGRQPLIRVPLLLHDGPFRLGANQSQSIPFSIRFPETPTQAQVELAQWPQDQRFISTPAQSLPPSMRLESYGGLMPGHHRFECFIEYRISALVTMDLDVKIAKYDEDSGTLVRYEQPEVPLSMLDQLQSTTFRDLVRLQNQYLLPEAERPAGFMQKTKAFFNNDKFPTYAFDVLLTSPVDIVLGQPINFNVRILPKPESSTAQQPPEIQYITSTITLTAHCDVRSDASGLFSISYDSTSDEKFLTVPGHVQDTSPFSPANDYHKVVSMKPIIGGCSTFSTFNITMSYSLSFKLELRVTEKTETMKNATAIRILPPLQGSSNTGLAPSYGAVAGPSTARDEQLPSYTSPANQANPPEYDTKRAPDSP